MDFLAFWMALGAMVIAILAAWFAKRQADAAEHANTMAIEANRLANETYRGMAFRWEIIQDTTVLFRLINTGLASAWDVRIWLPDHMNGERKGQSGGEMAPHTYISFSAFPKLAGESTGPIRIRWEDRTGTTPVEREVTTSLPYGKVMEKWDGKF
jgi:hypothetical protein